MDTQLIITFGILIAGLIYESTMFVYRKLSVGEQFSWDKFALTYGYVALLATSAYLVTGNIPQVDDIIVQIGNAIPEWPSVFTLATTVALGVIQKFLKTKGLTSTGGSPAVVVQQPTATPVPFPADGCNVKMFINGVQQTLTYGYISQVTAKFVFEATQPTADHPGFTSVVTNWDDGSASVTQLVNGAAGIDHTFVFVKEGKYTGKTFNPEFKFVRSDGAEVLINGEAGRIIDIGVEEP
jgi:hypothetical protein